MGEKKVAWWYFFGRHGDLATVSHTELAVSSLHEL